MCRCPTPIIFVYIRRNRSHQHKASSRKNNNSDSDGGAKTHSYRTAKFTRIFRTGKFGCFCLKFISKHSRAPPLSFVQIQQIYTKGWNYEIIFWFRKRTVRNII